MIPNITVTFQSNKTISIANTSGSDIDLTFQTLSPIGSWVPNSNVSVFKNTSLLLTLADGVYTFTLETNSIVFYIYGTILDSLKIMLQTILNNPVNVNNPSRYDMISLIILGIIYLGNTDYQNITYIYSIETDSNLTKISSAINDSTKYLDNVNNTPQSNLKWI